MIGISGNQMWLAGNLRCTSRSSDVKGSLRAPESGSLRAPWDHLEHQKSGSLRAPENHTFRVTLGDTGLGHGQAQQPHHLSCCPADTRTALLFHDQLPVGWGNNVHVPVHTQARRSCYVVTSSSSDLQDVPDTL